MTFAQHSDISVLLENSKDPLGRSFLYEGPERLVRADGPDDVGAAFEAIEEGLAQGLYAAGWVAYEVGYLLEPRLRALFPAEGAGPLVWFGLFARRKVLRGAELEAFWEARAGQGTFEIDVGEPAVDKADYLSMLARIQDYLAAGDVYQVNYTFPIPVSLSGDIFAAYKALRAAQPVEYGACIVAPDHYVASYSPELFVKKQGGTLTAKPMKGTARRGRYVQEDRVSAQDLASDEKSRAENLMIVDLLRNDLSRLAEPGSVEVESLYDVETYPTVLQMTSTIAAKARDGLTLSDLFKGLFPCGSVTGAPKIRAMEIIRELEDRPRGLYTGAIGHIEPGGDFCFNVPIRTLVLDETGRGVFATGSGIVADSRPEAEFEECMLKARFLESASSPPELIETILWRRPGSESGGGYWLLEHHLSRLSGSASYFGYPCEEKEIRAALEDFAASLVPQISWRVRILLAPSGAFSITASPIAMPKPGSKTDSRSAVQTFVISHCRTESSNPYLFHKTTHRRFYDDAYAAQAAPYGHIDVVFLNERGEITEGSRSNIFARIGEKICTPPIDCGVLAGTFRASLLEDSAQNVCERILTLDDLKTAEQLFLGNSITGLIEVRFSEIVGPRV